MLKPHISFRHTTRSADSLPHHFCSMGIRNYWNILNLSCNSHWFKSNEYIQNKIYSTCKNCVNLHQVNEVLSTTNVQVKNNVNITALAFSLIVVFTDVFDSRREVKQRTAVLPVLIRPERGKSAETDGPHCHLNPCPHGFHLHLHFKVIS